LGIRSLPLWSYSGPVNSAPRFAFSRFHFLVIVAFAVDATSGPYGASFVKPSLIVP
jgi:hypothetical protein